MKIGTELRRMAVALPMAAALLAACGDEGGELREATERRRAQQALLDSTGDTTAVARTADDTGYQVPAFDQRDTAVRPPTDTAGPDSAPPRPLSPQWTTGVREVGRPGATITLLRDVRVGRNSDFDRVVLQFEGPAVPGWHVEYVDGPVRQCGSGEPTQVAGNAWLLVRLSPAQAHDDAGRSTMRRDRDVNLPIIRELEQVCDFEGQVELVIGVASPNPYRVTEVPNPTRLVIDIQQ
ncbi:MAG TPA: hypothetical protein VFQ39_18780 [Longimicrobium sp.]|nr:hypothetical protein [Longimicrobium sp.]